jgi:hypothetical protein
MMDDSRKRAEATALKFGLDLVRRRRATETLAVDVPDPRPLKILPKESPVDRVRSIANAHPVSREWRLTLESIAPFSLTVPWLAFGWLDKAERWMIYEYVPKCLIPVTKIEQLSGTPYWKMPPTLSQGRQQMVSAYQWEMYRKHQVWARPFWCLQGEHGGTPCRYTEREEAILKAQGLDTSPPGPGVLPYAAFDGRVEHQIRERDQMRRANTILDRLSLQGKKALMIAETAEAERAFREHFFAWWTETMKPQADFIAWVSKSGDRMAGVSEGFMRPATDAEMIAGHELKDTYLETGLIPSAGDSLI